MQENEEPQIIQILTSWQSRVGRPLKKTNYIKNAKIELSHKYPKRAAVDKKVQRGLYTYVQLQMRNTNISHTSTMNVPPSQLVLLPRVNFEPPKWFPVYETQKNRIIEPLFKLAFKELPWPLILV